MKTGAVLKSLHRFSRDSEGPYCPISFSSDGKKLIGELYPFFGRSAVIWTIADGSKQRLKIGSSHTGLQFVGVDTEIWFTIDGAVYRLISATGEFTRFDIEQPALDIAISCDNKLLAVAVLGGIQIYERQTMRIQPQSLSPAGEVLPIWFTSGSEIVLRQDSAESEFKENFSSSNTTAWNVWSQDGTLRRQVKVQHMYGVHQAPLFHISPELTKFAEWRFNLEVLETGTNEILQTCLTSVHNSEQLRGAPTLPWTTESTYILSRNGQWINVVDVSSGKTEKVDIGEKRIIQITRLSEDGKSAILLTEMPKGQGKPARKEIIVIDLRKRSQRVVSTKYNYLHAVSRDGLLFAGSLPEVNSDYDWGDTSISDGRNGKAHFTIPANTARVSHCHFTRDSRSVAVEGLLCKKGTDQFSESAIVWYEIFTHKPRRKIRIASPADQLELSPDGRTLATRHNDAPVFLWDVYGERSAPMPKPNADGLRRAWFDLAATDAELAFKAICLLVQHPEPACRFLGTMLEPVKPIDPKQVREQVKSLSNRDYRIRAAAHLELAKEIDRTQGLLKELMDNGTGTLEGDTRLERLLALDTPRSPENIRRMRAVEVLELCGEPAREILMRCGKGEAGALLTTESAKSLARMKP